MIKLIIAEDHHLVRQGLRALLEAQSNLQIVGEAENGAQAIRLAEQYSPDVMIVDLMMPGLNGLEVARSVRQRASQIKVIILSMHDNEAYVAEALSTGAAGYVLKQSSAADLVEAIQTVMAGRRYLSPMLSERALEAYTQYIQQVKDTSQDPYDMLTPREREVLHLAAEGYTNAEIAQRLLISPRTVEVHRANMMRKLGLRNQTDLIRFAMQRGILPL